MLVSILDSRLGQHFVNARTVCAFGQPDASRTTTQESLDGVDAVVHLLGEPIGGGRWTEEKKRAIRDTRVLGTRHLVEALANRDDRPKTLLNASAIGYYGDRGEEALDESSDPGPDDDLMARVCKEWEAEAERATDLGLRDSRAWPGPALGSLGAPSKPGGFPLSGFRREVRL